MDSVVAICNPAKGAAMVDLNHQGWTRLPSPEGTGSEKPAFKLLKLLFVRMPEHHLVIYSDVQNWDTLVSRFQTGISV